MSRPAKGHTGRQRRMACDVCGFICYASAGAIRKYGVPSCACGAELTITHMRDAVKVSPAHAAVLALDVQAKQDAEDAEAYREWSERDARRAQRKGEAEARRGFRSGACNCPTCGRFKAKPADVCEYCGDDPVTARSYNGAENRAAEDAEFNRAHGYAA